ncbi:hypothetical protein [Actinoplanes sp. NPDC020271]|uniref:hypothetical protein n=1 Tax=Actinoplanes sp. NPDC020271 TaxID=3363896 RepID=UPI0037932F75
MARRVLLDTADPGSALRGRLRAIAGVDDVLTVINAVAWANEQAGAGGAGPDRLLARATTGLPG